MRERPVCAPADGRVFEDGWEPLMSMRAAVICIGALAAASAAAEELGPQDAWAFMVGKPFTLNCANGTTGVGHILPDGSVVGKIRIGSSGEVRSGRLPPGTVRVSGTGMCAYFAGLPAPPCLKVQRIDRLRFHASLSVLGFSLCEIDSVTSPSLRRVRDR
jgi:hypothetical protein